jgi:hypothetical protein
MVSCESGSGSTRSVAKKAVHAVKQNPQKKGFRMRKGSLLRIHAGILGKSFRIFLKMRAMPATRELSIKRVRVMGLWDGK